MRIRPQRGFTLLEILVVLVIAGFVTGILFQALSQIYRLQERFGQQFEESQTGAMKIDWFRLVVQGLQTDYPLGQYVFSGRADGFRGLSVGALTAVGGLPQEIEVSVRYQASEDQTQLSYEAAGRQALLLSWKGRRGGLAYLDVLGQEHAQWPPLGAGDWPQLPQVVLLKMPGESGLVSLAAVPRGGGEPRLRPFQFGVDR